MYIEKLKNGKVRFIQSYKDPITGKNKKVYCTFDKENKNNAFAAAGILQEKINNKLADFNASEDLRLSVLFKKFLQYKSNQVKPQTVVVYGTYLENILTVLGDLRIKDLNVRLLQSKFDNSGKGLVTLNTYIRILKIFLKWAYKFEYIKNDNIIKRLEFYREPAKKDKNLRKYLEEDELQTLLSHLPENDIKSYMIKFLVLSGCRIGEACALTLSDIDLINRNITINKAYNVTIKAVSTAKTKTSERSVYIQDELSVFLNKYLRFRNEKLFHLGINTDLLFFSEHGAVFNYNYFDFYFRNLTKKVIGRGLSTHSLRHTHCSLMFEQGVSLEAISARLGHADSKITKEIYLHITSKKLDQYNAAIKSKKIL